MTVTRHVSDTVMCQWQCHMTVTHDTDTWQWHMTVTLHINDTVMCQCHCHMTVSHNSDSVTWQWHIIATLTHDSDTIVWQQHYCSLTDCTATVEFTIVISHDINTSSQRHGHEHGYPSNRLPSHIGITCIRTTVDDITACWPAGWLVTS